MMRTFKLLRHRDVSGVSGVGEVATGIEWDHGTVAIRWHGETPSTVVWDSIHDAMRVHSHGGATELVWDGAERPEPPERTGLQVVADLIAGGLGYTGINQHCGRQTEVHCSPQEWLAWLDALGGSADASVFVDRGSEKWPQQREWTTPDGQIKVLHLIPAEAS